MHKRVLTVVVSFALLVGISTPATADENPIPTDDRERVLTKPWDSHLDPKKMWITYGAMGGLAIMPGPVFLQNLTKEEFCETSLPDCARPGDGFFASGHATFCGSTQQIPCIEKLEIRRQGESQWQIAQFENYWDASPSSGTLAEFRKQIEDGKDFSGIRQISTKKGWATNSALKLMGSGPGPLMFSAPEYPSKGNTTKYMVEPYFVQFLNDFRQGKFSSITYDTFYVNIRPIAEVMSTNAKASVEAIAITPSGKPWHGGFGVGGHNGNYYSVDGRYAFSAGFDPTLQLQVTMQIPSEIGGWFHSRLKEPNLQLSTISPGVSRLVLSGGSTEVPITNTAVEAFDPANQKYYDYIGGKNNEYLEDRRRNGGGGMTGGFWDPNNGLESFKFWFSS